MIPSPSSNNSRRDRNERVLSEINAVPYIDVMLVLLVIFIITAPFLKSAVDVELPETEVANRKSEPQRPLIVTVNAKGEYFLNVGQDAGKPRPLGDIIEDLRKVRDTRKDFEVLVHGDTKVSYGLVADLISELQGAGIRKATLVTQPRPRRKR